MKSERIAKRYAKALFSLALEKNLLEQIYSDMLVLKSVCKESKEFMHLLHSPVISFSKKISVFKEIFFGKLTPLSFEFLEIIARKKREMIIREIAAEFALIYKEYKNIRTVYFTTAAPASEKNIQQLKVALGRVFTSEIELIQTVDENLIGGFVFKVDDLQYDATVRRNITRLKKEYNVNIYVPQI